MNNEKEIEVFDSLDSLIAASNTLMPPFKTDRIENEPFKQSKFYTQSKTILASNEHSMIPDGLIDCEIKEIISRKDDDNSELLAPPYVIAEAK